MEKSKNKKVQFVVVREFSGDKTMREAFEQVSSARPVNSLKMAGKS